MGMKKNMSYEEGELQSGGGTRAGTVSMEEGVLKGVL